MSNERSSFDNKWKEAFEDAELNPSDGLWEKIQLQVAQESQSKMKKRLLFFKLMAAASVAFALSIVGAGIYYINYNKGEDQYMAENKAATNAAGEVVKKQEEGQSTGGKGQAKQKMAPGQATNAAITSSQEKREGELNAKNESNKAGNNTVLIEGNKTKNDLKSTVDKANIKGSNGIAGSKGRNNKITEAPPVYASEDTQPGDDMKAVVLQSAGKDGAMITDADLIAFRQLDYDIGKLLEREMEMVPWYSYIPPNDNKKGTKNMWIGIGAAAGRNDPNGTSSGGARASTAQFANNSVAGLEYYNTEVAAQRGPYLGKEKVGDVYQVGLDVGTKLSKRFLVQGGLSFMQRNTSFESNVIIQQGSTAKVVSNLDYIHSDALVDITQAYEVENSYHSLSVPLQAGYIVLDRQFRITVLGGVANEFLLYNEMQADGTALEDQRIKSGEDGLNLYIVSGLLSTDFGYRIGDNYLLSLQPQLRQSFTSFSDNQTTRPLIFTVGMRFRYLLK